MTLDLVAQATSFVDLAGLLEFGEVDGFSMDFVSWGFYAPAYWRNYAHTHSFVEVCLAYAGRGTFTVNDVDHEVAAGTVFIARPGDVHEIISSKTEPLGIAFWGFTFQPGRSVTPSSPGWWTGILRDDRAKVSTSLGNLPVLVASLAAEASRPRAGHQAQLAALGTALVIDTARAFATDDDLEVEARSRSRTSAVVATMERFLTDNLTRPISVRDVAAVVHLSERHAERVFNEQTGAPLMATLRRLRLERGAQLLLESTDSITAVARSCGYTEVRPFITAFRRHYGQPPRAFRSNGGTLHL